METTDSTDAVEATDTAEMPMRFNTKIAVIVRADLPVWQRLNMVAFLASGIATSEVDIVGEPYEDASGVYYLPMFRQPVLVFSAASEQLRTAYDRARARELPMAIFTDELFVTGHDGANRAAVRAVTGDKLSLAGLALRARRKQVDTVVKGLRLHE